MVGQWSNSNVTGRWLLELDYAHNWNKEETSIFVVSEWICSVQRLCKGLGIPMMLDKFS